MKRRVREAAQLMQDVASQVRTWFDPGLDAGARPLEVREAILDEIESRVEPAGRGRRVLPYNRVSVTLLARDDDRYAALDAVLMTLEGDAITRLEELSCEVPAGFAVALEYTRQPRDEWGPGRWIDIQFARAAVSLAPPAAADLPRLCLTVVRGTTSQPSFTLLERHVLIGRTSGPVDQRGRTRHNHVAFLEDGDDASRTVGRAHASIRYMPERREYRLFDDGSRNGTRVVRVGVVIEVPAHDPVGVVLQSGDELCFGSAGVQLRIEASRQ